MSSPRALGHEKQSKTNHFVREAGFIMTCGTCHNWLVVSSVMNLTRTTTRTEAHGEVWHAPEQGLERLHVIPADKCQNMVRAILPREGFSYFSKASEEAQRFTTSYGKGTRQSGH